MTYTFTVTNTGNVTLTGVGVTDAPTAPAGGVTATCQSLTTPPGTCSGATTSLVPGQTAIFSGTYTVTQADIDHGSIVDDATASGTPPYRNRGHRHVEHRHGHRGPVGFHRHRQVGVPTTVTGAGQIVTYTFTVTNTSNVSLTDVGVTDHPTRRREG